MFGCVPPTGQHDLKSFSTKLILSLQVIEFEKHKCTCIYLISVDLMNLQLNVNQATREYLERYVEKKIGSLKSTKESETEGAEKETVSASGAGTLKSSEESLKLPSDEKDNNEVNKESPDAANFGLVTDEDREGDREALEKLTGMIEERLKSRPLPPPPPPPQRNIDGPGNSNSEQPSGSKDRESEEDLAKNGE